MDEERAFQDLSDEEKERAYQDLLKERRDNQRLLVGFLIVMAIASTGEALIRGQFSALFGVAFGALLLFFMVLLAAQRRARERQRERERHTY